MAVRWLTLALSLAALGALCAPAAWAQHHHHHQREPVPFVPRVLRTRGYIPPDTYYQGYVPDEVYLRSLRGLKNPKPLISNISSFLNPYYFRRNGTIVR